MQSVLWPNAPIIGGWAVLFMKIHIFFEYDRVEKQVKFCKSFPKSNNYLEKPLSTKNSSGRPKQTEK